MPRMLSYFFLILTPVFAFAQINLAPKRQASPNVTKVDVALVLAVDISYSMDLDEQRLQREGYYHALTSPEVLGAITKGTHGRIAVSYVEWAGVHDVFVKMDWTLIDSPQAALAFVEELKRKPPQRARRTSISAGLEKSMEMLEKLPYFAERQVIDLSGDGANNDGKFIEPVRDAAVNKGITINGLPVMVKAPNAGWMDISNLDDYYADCVIGGQGAFMIPIKSEGEFLTATKRKMILEIAGISPSSQFGAYEGEVVKVQSRPKVDCLIGERMRQQRWGN